MKKRIFYITLTLCLLCGLLPTAASAATEVSYIEYSWNGDTSSLSHETKTATDYTEVTADTTAWADGKTYVVNGTVTIDQRVTIDGSVSLILTDGCALTVNGGIEVLDNETLTIYAQSEGTGKLTAATTDEKAAGIGGTSDQKGGAVNVHGGTVTATAGGKGSGIGGSAGNGSMGGAGGTVNVYGGSVTATGITGIGGGNGVYGSGGTTNIYGGFVTATARDSDGSGDSGAGIGGVGFSGVNNSASSTNIYGGVVTAIGGDGYHDGHGLYYTSAGIGGGYGNRGGAVTISGGIVNAEAGKDDRGTVTDAIGNGDSGSGVTVARTGGIIFENNSGKLYGTTFTLPVDYSTPAGKSLTVAKNQTLTIPAGMTLTLSGALTNNGTIENNGTLILTVPANKVSGSGGFSGNGGFIVTAISADDITVPEGLVYNDQDYTDYIEILEEATILGTEFTRDLTGWTRSFSPSPVYDAGEYTVTYTHPNLSTVTKTFSVAKANPGVGTVSYEGGTLYEGFAGSIVELSCRSTSIPGTLALTDERLTAGTNTYNWQFTPDDSVNYEIVTGTIELTVSPDEVVSIAASGTPAKTAYVYGDTFEIDGVTVTATYSKGGTKDVTELVSFDALTAGQTEITLTYDGKTCTVGGITVAKKQLDVSGMSWSIPTDDDAVYDARPKSVSLEGTLPEGVSVETSGNLSAINAGDYTATATFSPADGYDSDNYEIVGTNPLTADWAITKATVVLPDVRRRFIRTVATTGNVIDVNTMLPDKPGLVIYQLTSDSYSVLKNVSAANGRLTFDTIVSDTAASDVITVRVSMQNYKTATLTVTVFLDEKTPQEITGVSAADGLIYNGAPQQGYIGTPASDYTGDYEIAYTGRGGTYNSATAPTDAGDYTVTVKIPDSDLYYSGNVSVDFSIGKAPVTVTADDKQVYAGSSLPELTYTVDGLVDGDTLDTTGLTMKYQKDGVDVAPADVDMSNAGTYDIVIEGTADNSGNYAITHTNGTLTISEPPYIPPYTPPDGEDDTTDDKAEGGTTTPDAPSGGVGGDTAANLTVSTSSADVTIPNGGSSELVGEGGVTLTVTAEKEGNRVTLKVTADGEAVNEVAGGITLTVPHEDIKPGTVAVIVREDGTREVIPKSISGDGTVTIPLTGSATVELVDNSKSFDDVADDAWYSEAVDFVSARGLFGGISDTVAIFDGDSSMTRGMLAVVLHRLESEPEQAFTGSFDDVADGAWYTDAILWMAETGIAVGYGDGDFGAEDDITREQIAVMLWRYAGSPTATNEELNFTDADEVSDWAMDALIWAQENGILQGYNGAVNPRGTATRAHAAEIIKNFMENVLKR